MSESKPLWAPVKWAQRKEALYVTVDLPDVKDEKVTLSNTNLTFKGTSNGQEYEVTLDFLKEVDAESKESIWAKTDRNLHFYIVKKNQDEEFWPRLLTDKHLEKTNVKVDWSKFVDEDEDEGQSSFDMSALNGGGGFDINQMMAAQNASGMMGDEGSDSEDEDMPDLDPNEQ
uniref:CS domain-containing protein n=1 Tax=Hyaloperonospora arabidopsidis (strain Emoy2) TaxID=559515 RepID=M4BVQ9_HYAAE